jgi:hypothetical protein
MNQSIKSNLVVTLFLRLMPLVFALTALSE